MEVWGSERERREGRLRETRRETENLQWFGQA
jgi:hypothetical protein